MNKSMNGFEKRLEIGTGAERAIEKYIRNIGFNVKRNIVTPGDAKSIINNLKWGDIFIEYDNQKFSFDVKFGTFISQKSFTSYMGQFYILLPGGDLSEKAIKDARVIKSSTIKSYIRKRPLNKRTTAPSGDIGYRFKMIKNYIRLEDFLISLVKYKLSSRDYFSFQSDLKRNFNKVLPVSANTENGKHFLAKEI